MSGYCQENEDCDCCYCQEFKRQLDADLEQALAYTKMFNQVMNCILPAPKPKEKIVVTISDPATGAMQEQAEEIRQSDGKG